MPCKGEPHLCPHSLSHLAQLKRLTLNPTRILNKCGMLSILQSVYEFYVLLVKDGQWFLSYASKFYNFRIFSLLLSMLQITQFVFSLTSLVPWSALSNVVNKTQFLLVTFF